MGPSDEVDFGIVLASVAGEVFESDTVDSIGGFDRSHDSPVTTFVFRAIAMDFPGAIAGFTVTVGRIVVALVVVRASTAPCAMDFRWLPNLEAAVDSLSRDAVAVEDLWDTSSDF